MALERVQKIIARAGIASRRQCEDMIREGEVTINGKVAQLGDKAEAGKDSIKVKGKLLQFKSPLIYLAFNKPKGVISVVGKDPQGRATLGDYLSKIKARLFPVGRMDFNSEGLILLTNDGDLAEKLQKSERLARIYLVKVKGHPDAEMLKDLAKPARINGRSVAPHSVRLADKFAQKAMIEVCLVGFGAVDVKGFLEFKGCLVERVIRRAIGQINIENLPPGQFKFLKKSQLEALLSQPELGLKDLAPETLPKPPTRKIELPKPRRTPLRPAPRAALKPSRSAIKPRKG